MEGGGATKGVNLPPHRGSGCRAPSGGAGAEPPAGSLGGEAPPEAEAEEYFRSVSESVLVM